MSENSQLNKTYALLKEVYGPLENLSQTQWSQIERGVKALMKEHGPDIPLESLKAFKDSRGISGPCSFINAFTPRSICDHCV